MGFVAQGLIRWEARRFDRTRVETRRDARNDVIARFVGGRLTFHAALVPCSDLGAGNARSRGVFDESGYSPEVGLGRSDSYAAKHHNEQKNTSHHGQKRRIRLLHW